MALERSFHSPASEGMRFDNLSKWKYSTWDFIFAPRTLGRVLFCRFAFWNVFPGKITRVRQIDKLYRSSVSTNQRWRGLFKWLMLKFQQIHRFCMIELYFWTKFLRWRKRNFLDFVKDKRAKKQAQITGFSQTPLAAQRRGHLRKLER